MLRKTAALFFLMLSSCAPGQRGEVWCVTDRFRWVLTGTPNLSSCEDYNKSEMTIIQGLWELEDYDSRFRQAHHKVRDIELFFREDGVWDCNDERCLAGQAFCKEGVLEIGRDYISGSSLVHELAHIAQGCWADFTKGETIYPSTGTPAPGHWGWNPINKKVDEINAKLLEMGL